MQLLRNLIPARVVRAVLVLAIVLAHSTQAQTFKVLHVFAGGFADGSYPWTERLLLYAGSLYGTTNTGGPAYDGTVFQISLANGQETILHAFAGGSDGAFPFAGLIRDSAGNLYGTTRGGDILDAGTVFEINSAGVESLLHSFLVSEGRCPQGGLVRDSAGNLYGTAESGGVTNSNCANGCGTVFRLDTAGTLTVLHRFTGSPDGSLPPSGLLMVKGNLFGTTLSGGTYNNGTVFALNSGTGKTSVLYNFTGGADGAQPYGPVIGDGAGNLYGTTTVGGSNNVGVVFKLDIASRQETVLHTFSSVDGANPYAGLVRDSAGNLYGTTVNGGAFNFGTVFELDTTGNLITLHSFTGGKDGAYPQPGLVRDSKGNLYGAASYGGLAAGLSGAGTIFKVIP